MSNGPAVIQGSLVDAKNVASHKCVRLSIDVPAEMGTQIVTAFGWPTMAEPVAVAVARLDLTANGNGKPNDNWKPDEINIASLCALVCQKPTFWEYIRAVKGVPCIGEQDAATYVRRFCIVNTRADLATNETALSRWQFLESAYEDWLGTDR
jgi:hypothetical protein